MVFKISKFVITMLLVGAVFVGFYSLLAELAGDTAWNTSNVDIKYMNKYNKLTNLSMHSQQLIEEVKSNITEQEDKQFFTGLWDAAKISKDAVIGTGKMTISSMGIAKDLTYDFANDTGITSELDNQGSIAGTYIQNLLIAILTILIVSAILYVILRREW